MDEKIDRKSSLPATSRVQGACPRLLVFGLLLSVLNCLEATTPALVWNDEFNGAVGSAPNPDNWTYDLGTGAPSDIGWGNNELESYTNSTQNASIVSDAQATDGLALSITAIKSGSSYTSARIKTEGLYSFTYGRLEARMKLPTGQGLWPAFWALGTDITTVSWPACGEMDIMEWGEAGASDTQTNQTSHWSSNGSEASYGGTYNLPTDYNADYHVFAVDWYPSYLIYSVDGNVVSTAVLSTSTIPAFSDPFFIILNMAVGGNFTTSPPPAGTSFPQSLLVDYVRVYSLPNTPPSLTQIEWAPSSPQSLDVSVSGTTATLTWQAPFSTFGSAVTQYVVQRATDSGFSQNLTSWTVGAVLTYADTSIDNTTNYYYRVEAVTALGTSDPSTAAELAQVGVTPTPTPTPTPPPDGSTARLTNLSCRAQVGTGSNVVIAGFVSGGAGTSGSQSVLVRGSGPALGIAPFSISGVLADPSLTLTNVTNSENVVVATDTGWGGNASIASEAAAVGAFSWGSAATADSALYEPVLASGNYTAEIAGKIGDTGIALVEVYDATPAGTFTLSSPRLTNLSARVQVGTGANGVFAGFVIGGTGNETVLIRASGPALALSPFKLTGTLPDPQLTLTNVGVSPNVVITTNAGWGGSASIVNAASAVGAFPWSSTSSKDSAILVTLPPGNYTAGVAGASGDSGIALVEIYEVQ